MISDSRLIDDTLAAVENASGLLSRVHTWLGKDRSEPRRARASLDRVALLLRDRSDGRAWLALREGELILLRRALRCLPEQDQERDLERALLLAQLEAQRAIAAAREAE